MHGQWGWRAYRTAAKVSVYLLYPTICDGVVKLLDCSDPIDGVSYVSSDFRVSCNTAKHAAHAVVAYVVLVVVCLGMPVAIAVVLWPRGRSTAEMNRVAGNFAFFTDGYKVSQCPVYDAAVDFVQSIGL